MAEVNRSVIKVADILLSESGNKPPVPAEKTQATDEKAQSSLSDKDKSTIKIGVKGNSATVIEFSEQKNEPLVHKVKSGESLSSIAKKYLGDERRYMEIFALNKGKNFPHPNSILFVGKELKLPPDAKIPDSEKSSEQNNETGPKQYKVTTKPVVGNVLKQYQRENPVSYITMDAINKKSEETPTKLDKEDETFYSSFISDHNTSASNLYNKSVVYTDAVKVNANFDIHPTKNINNDINKWAAKVGNVLAENNASIRVGSGDKSIVIDSNLLNAFVEKMKSNKSEALAEFKALLSDKAGVAFNNTLLAIDDITSNLKNNPYYTEIKPNKKTFDLASVANEFKITSNKNDYMRNLLSHKHRQIPVQVEGADIKTKTNTPQDPVQIINDLSKHFDGKGNLKDPIGFEKMVYKVLDNQAARGELINHFKLNSNQNIEALIPGITSEGGSKESQRDYNSYFAVGSVILNRTLGRNIRQAAQSEAKGISPEKVKLFTVHDILNEAKQFEVMDRKVEGTNQSFYQQQKALHNSFKKDKLAEGPSKNAFEIAYEVTNDLMSGINKLSAEVDGSPQKNAGRSTSNLFYFNQSRSVDHSKVSKIDSAVTMIDKNNTHVFFKEWNDRAFFRD